MKNLYKLDYSRAKPPTLPNIIVDEEVAHELYFYTTIGLQGSRCGKIGSPVRQ